jgi:hypothetical protein
MIRFIRMIYSALLPFAFVRSLAPMLYTPIRFACVLRISRDATETRFNLLHIVAHLLTSDIISVAGVQQN